MKKLVILGSTGSIGRQALEVVSWFPADFGVYALTGASNLELLAEQAQKYRPPIVVISDESKYTELRALLPDYPGRILAGKQSLEEVAESGEADLVVAAISGVAGLAPVWRAISAGKTVCLANKEVLVSAGEAVMGLVREKGSVLLPVDSEHSAIFQCLQGNQDAVSSLVITASGGPFRGKTLAEMEKITPRQALAHPTWSMGPKISIDSATLMNKGLEIMEAHWLFNIPYAKIKVVVHRESIIHSLVQYGDGSMLAHLGPHDMRIPIQYALSWPRRLDNPLKELDLAEIGALHFESPDTTNFPCLALAYAAGQRGGTYPAALNAANEELVRAFLAGQISFGDIPRYNERVLEAHEGYSGSGLEPVYAADTWARELLKKDLLKTEGN